MKITLGDPPHQVKWRSKQIIDQSYLMQYVHGLNTKYYLGIEDDVSAAENYLEIIFQVSVTKLRALFPHKFKSCRCAYFEPYFKEEYPLLSSCE